MSSLEVAPLPPSKNTTTERTNARGGDHRLDASEWSQDDPHYDATLSLRIACRQNAVAALNAEPLGGPVGLSSGQPKRYSLAMSIKEDAGRVLHALAEFGNGPDDHQRGRHRLPGTTVQAALDSLQGCTMSPERINDAVKVLESSGYVQVHGALGTAPYHFYSVELTPAGRLQYEESTARRNAQSASQVTESPPTEASVRIFISHSSRDVEIVGLLITLVRSALNLPAVQIRCTSVDGYRLRGGADTTAQLRHEVNEATVLLGVLSAVSLNSLFVVFELGARWGNGKTFIPLLAPGTPSSVLGGPLSGINSLRLDSEPQIHQLLSELGGHLHVAIENPAVYKPQLDAFLAKAEELQSAAISAGLQAAPTKDTAVASTGVVDGADQITVPCALASHYFATEPDGETCVLQDCLVLVCAEEISDMRSFLPILEKVARAEKPLLVLAPRVAGDAMPTLIKNTQVGRLRTCVVTPSSTADPSALFRLVARSTSATVFRDEAALPLESATLEQLGRARRAETHAGATVITKETERVAAQLTP